MPWSVSSNSNHHSSSSISRRESLKPASGVSVSHPNFFLQRLHCQRPSAKFQNLRVQPHRIQRVRPPNRASRHMACSCVLVNPWINICRIRGYHNKQTPANTNCTNLLIYHYSDLYFVYYFSFF